MGKDEKPFRLADRLNSFRYAFRGLAQLLRREHNYRIHLAVAVLVIAAGLLLNISSAEWLIIILTIGIVLVAEALNSAVERLCDIVSPDDDQRIKNIKDVLAAAVLISAIMAVIIGLIVFIPYLLNYIGK